jgi:N-acyl-L-homoserine lactone synthetase
MIPLPLRAAAFGLTLAARAKVQSSTEVGMTLLCSVRGCSESLGVVSTTQPTVAWVRILRREGFPTHVPHSPPPLRCKLGTHG